MFANCSRTVYNAKFITYFYDKNCINCIILSSPHPSDSSEELRTILEHIANKFINATSFSFYTGLTQSECRMGLGWLQTDPDSS